MPGSLEPPRPRHNTAWEREGGKPRGLPGPRAGNPGARVARGRRRPGHPAGLGSSTLQPSAARRPSFRPNPGPQSSPAASSPRVDCCSPGRGSRSYPRGLPTVPGSRAVALSWAPGAAVRASEGRGADGAEALAELGPGARQPALGEESTAGKIPVPGPSLLLCGLSARRANGICPGIRSTCCGLARGEGRRGGGTPRGYVMDGLAVT